MKKLFFFALIAFICLASKLSAQTSTTTTVGLTQTGLDLYDEHKYKESIVKFNEAIKENSKDGKAFYYRGLAKMHDGKKGFCKDLEESLTLGYSQKSDIYYYGCETMDKNRK